MKEFLTQPDQTKWSVSIVERGGIFTPIAADRDGEAIDLSSFSVTLTDSVEEVFTDDGNGRRRTYLAKVGDVWWVHIDGHTSRITVVEKGVANAFESSGSLTSPMPGKVLTVMCKVGEKVEEGQPLLVLEAMKMEHRICAPAAGTVSSIHYEAGAQVDQGAVLLAIDTDD